MWLAADGRRGQGAVARDRPSGVSAKYCCGKLRTETMVVIVVHIRQRLVHVLPNVFATPILMSRANCFVGSFFI